MPKLVSPWRDPPLLMRPDPFALRYDITIAILQPEKAFCAFQVLTNSTCSTDDQSSSASPGIIFDFGES